MFAVYSSAALPLQNKVKTVIYHNVAGETAFNLFQINEVNNLEEFVIDIVILTQKRNGSYSYFS